MNVSVDVTNNGTLAGDEVVQLYVKYPGSAVPRPNKQLRGFSRVNIAAGATTTVTIPLLYKDIAYWDSTQSTWVAENGNIQVLVGGSSDSSALTLSKTVSVCSGIVGVIQARSTDGSLETVSSMTCPMSIVRQGGAMGIALTFASAADYDLSVFDLKGARAGRSSGKLADGKELPVFGLDPASRGTIHGFRAHRRQCVCNDVHGEVSNRFIVSFVAILPFKKFLKRKNGFFWRLRRIIY